MGRHNHNRGEKGAGESLASGLVLAGAFVAFWAFGGHPVWALLVAVFAGVLPASRGLSGLVAARAERKALEAKNTTPKIDAKSAAARGEKTVLRVARDKGGRVTPSLVALESDLSVEDAEKALDDLAKKGHASIIVREDGRIEYEFIEFLPVQDR
jgi:hypothetical protein